MHCFTWRCGATFEQHDSHREEGIGGSFDLEDIHKEERMVGDRPAMTRSTGVPGVGEYLHLRSHARP